MLDFNSLLTFSHTYCIAICAALVPLNLIATLSTLVLTGLNRPKAQILRSASLAILFALIMVLHVMSWFWVGVVMIPTFVLMALGGCCLSINLWAAGQPSSMQETLKRLARFARQSLQSTVQRV